MNANNPHSPPPAPRRGPFCPNCLRGEGRHFPACPLDFGRALTFERGAVVQRDVSTGRRVSLDLSKEPDKSAIVITDAKGKVVERHEIPGRVREGCPVCHGTGEVLEGDLSTGKAEKVRCSACGGTGGH